MKVSGFYMVAAIDKFEAEAIARYILENEFIDSDRPYFGNSSYEIIDVLYYCKSHEEGKDEYDVHFIIDLPEIKELEEDTDLFYELEGIIDTGLSVLKE